MSAAGRALVTSRVSRACLLCGKQIEPGTLAAVTKGGFRWMHPKCAAWLGVAR